MNELGPDSARLHEETGRILPLRAGDTLVLFGGDSAAIGAGAAAAGFPSASIFLLPDIASVRAAVESSPAPVLLKGSRSYALERALPWENPAQPSNQPPTTNH
jgi:UDP-N-acetylmuramyl pentapeptide synthase